MDPIILTHKNHVSSLANVLEGVLINGRLSDVILITSDNIKIPAHKLILSSFSPLFQDIFLESSYDIPIIYLRGISQSILKLVLEFIYQGYCEMPSDMLDDFLKVAVDLQIKGLDDQYVNKRIIPTSNKAREINVSIQDSGLQITNISQNSVDEGSFKPEENDLEIEKYLHGSHEQPRGQFVEVIDSNKVEIVETNSTPFGSNSHKKKYMCDDCGLKFNQKDGLGSHQRKKHNIVSDEFKCRQCNYRASSKHPLLLHISSVHEKIRYKCDQCDYQATQKCALQPHKQTKHEGVKFACEVCGAILVSGPVLKKHLEYKHGNRKHSCDDCNYIAGQQHHLKTHRKMKHDDNN